MLKEHTILCIFYSAFILSSSMLQADDLSNSQDCSHDIPVFDDSKLLTAEERIKRMNAALDRSLNRFEACDTNATNSNAQNNPDAAADSSTGEAAKQQTSDGTDGSAKNSNDVENNDSGNAPLPTASGVSENKPAGTTENGNAPLPTASGISGNEPTEATENGNVPLPTASGVSGDEATESGNVPLPTAGGVSGDEPEGSANAPSLPDQAEEKDDRLTKDKEGVGYGKTPEDIPPTDNDDAFAAQLREAAQAEKDPQKQAAYWKMYREYKGLPPAK